MYLASHSQTFKDIKPNESFQYGSSNGAHFVSPDIIYDFGLAEVNGNPEYAVIRTTNAGINWSIYFVGPALFKAFYGEDTMFFLSDNKIFRTFNDFDTYDSIVLLSIQWLTKANNNLYILGSKTSTKYDSLKIFRSDNFGNYWELISDKPLENIIFVNDSVGYARYQDNITNKTIITKTSDNGFTWKEIQNATIGRDYFENAVYQLWPDGYPSGNGFQKSVDEGISWTPINSGIPDDIVFGQWPEEAGRLWKFISPTTGFFYEHQYGLFKTIDGGQNWKPIWNDFRLYTNDMHIIYENKKVYFFLCTNNSASYNMYYGVFDSLDIWNSIDTEAPLKNKIRVFPNPAKEEVNIQTSGFFNMNTSIRVYDAAGKQVLETKLQIPQTTIDISGLDKGIYFLKILNGDGEFVEKLIKD